MGIWLAPILALLIGLIGVLGTNALITFVIPWTHTALTVALLLISALIFTVILHPRFYLTPTPSLVFWVPLLTHLYTLFAGWISGVILRPPFLLGMSLAMLVIALYLHRPTMRQSIARISNASHYRTPKRQH